MQFFWEGPVVTESKLSCVNVSVNGSDFHVSLMSRWLIQVVPWHIHLEDESSKLGRQDGYWVEMSLFGLICHMTLK